MKFVVPMTVTSTNLTTNVINDYADWAAGTYVLGTRKVEGESVYEVVASPSTTDQPTVGAAKATPTWILLGFANIWRMWREGVDSPSEAVGDIEVSVPIPTVTTTVGVLRAVGLNVNVKIVDSTIMNIEAPTVENVGGTKDGVNTAFTISVAGTFVMLYLNGVRQVELTDYTRVGTAITAVASIPFTGDSYVAEIFTLDEPALENIGGTKNGSNTAFTISEALGVARIFLNGRELVEGVSADYTRVGTAITAVNSIPFLADVYEAIIYTGNVPIVETIYGTKNGLNASFLISVDGTATLLLNGIRQEEGVDYERVGIAVTATGSIPFPGDTYEAVIYPTIVFPGGVVYSLTKNISDIGVGDWWEFFFTGYTNETTLVFDDLPAYFGAGVTLHVTNYSTGPSDPSSVGRLVIGPVVDAGQSLAGVTSRNLTFSTKKRDEFGSLTIVSRRTIRVVDFPVMIPTSNTYSIQRQAADLASTPTLFIADPDLPETIVFGVFENFDIIVNGLSIVECSIGVEEF